MMARRNGNAPCSESVLAQDDDGRGTVLPMTWSADGRHLLLARSRGTGGSIDVDVLPLFGDRRRRPFLRTAADEVNARFSPDGRWIAYQSSEGDRSEIFVEAFPAGGARQQMSLGGGSNPVWRDDGRELYFVAPNGALMASAIDRAGSFRAGTPQQLFAVELRAGPNNQYGVSGDGQRFLVNQPESGSGETRLTALVHWLSASGR